MRKGENAGNHIFSIFTQCFLPCQTQKPSFEIDLTCELQLLPIAVDIKFGCLVMNNDLKQTISSTMVA